MLRAVAHAEKFHGRGFITTIFALSRQINKEKECENN